MDTGRTQSGAVYSAVLLAALVAVGHAAIFVRMADAHPLVTAAWRLAIATAVLLPFAATLARDEIRRMDRAQWRLIAWASVFLALHFATWIASLDYTSIANSVVLVTLTPVWLALWAVIVLRRPPDRRTWAAVMLAMAGSAIMGAGSARLGLATLGGDALALAGGILFMGFFLFAEVARQTVGLVAFVTLVYGGAAVLLWIAVLALGLPAGGFSTQTWLAFLGLGLVSQIVGHTGFNWAVRAISPMILAIVLLAEPLLSAGLGWLYFAEGFARETAWGGVVILAAIYLGVRAGENRPGAQTG